MPRRSAAAVAALLALAAASACSGGDGASGPATTGTRAPGAPSASTTTAVPAASSADLVAAACAGTLAAETSEPIEAPALAEVSGVAPTPVRTWVHNDSGDSARLFGIGADGSVQEVLVGGAEAVDWEDLTVVGGDDAHLWIADTGDNARARSSVQLYRVPVPAPGDTDASSARVDVTYPDGPHDVEAVAADPDGGLYLLTKFESPALLFRVDPPEGDGAVVAQLVGEAALGGTAIPTSMAIAPDRRAVAVRTYDSAWLYPLAEGQDVAAALADADARCPAPAGAELQGEAIGFLADGSAYVTIGEGANPVLARFSAP